MRSRTGGLDPERQKLSRALVPAWRFREAIAARKPLRLGRPACATYRTCDRGRLCPRRVAGGSSPSRSASGQHLQCASHFASSGAVCGSTSALLRPGAIDIRTRAGLPWSSLLARLFGPQWAAVPELFRSCGPSWRRRRTAAAGNWCRRARRICRGFARWRGRISTALQRMRFVASKAPSWNLGR